MDIVICDDEVAIREMLTGKIFAKFPDVNITDYESGERLLLQDREPDILFLDIQMSGRNGMEIARELRKKWKNTILIFITALEEYVFEAFDVGAFHYIVKPFTDEKFGEVFGKAIEQCTKNEIENEDREKYLMVNYGKTHSKVMIDDIVYAEVFNRKIVLHKIDEEIEYYGKMTELEKEVGDTFFRTHRAYLVNFKYVEKYDSTNIYLEKGEALLAKQK